MAELLGIIAPLKKFLSATDEEIKMSFERNQNTILSLDAGRIYDIPDFQREIRWDEDNVSVLLNDIKNGPKFLGNIILTKHDNKQFSIIDGQQRITVLTMMLNCIKYLYQNEIDIITPCKLTVESFSSFNKLMKQHFPEELLTNAEIIESDKLQQAQKYYRLWHYIINLEEIQQKRKAKELLQNLGKSSLNIIINESDDVSNGIRYFLDVNLKGKQLDTEDIFKSYLFSNDFGEEIRLQWYKLKRNVVEIERCKINYPLLKLLEHYFYCDLYLNDNYKGIDFGTDFLLNKNHKNADSDDIYRKGTHIIEVIDRKDYMRTALSSINDIILLILEIVRSTSSTEKLKELFFFIDSNGNQKQLDNKELKVIHNLMSKIFKDPNIPPKALIMKYILLVILKKPSRSKDNIRQIYGVYMFTILFTIFENKKSKEVLMGILKSKENIWYSELIKQLNGYFSLDKITDNRLLAQYKLGRNENEEDFKIRCKSLATIYNYFHINNQKVTIRKGMTDELYRFVLDDDSYSIEHFIINNSKNRIIKSSSYFKEYEINRTIYNRFVNNFFNFIFINRKTNSILSNYWLPEKIDSIDIETVDCEYSKMIINNLLPLKKEFEKQATSDYKNKLDLFFARDFKDLYIDYAKKVLIDVMEKIKS